MDSTAFPPMTIFVFTCNATDRLEARFLSRCRKLEFSTYGLGPEIICLLKQVWNEEAPDAEAPNFARIVKVSANNARDALTKLELALMEA
jgi:DNA polymerase III gamma/tau subunit